MLQDPISKPPDVQLDVSRPPTDRRHKANSNPEQVLKCPRCESMNTKFCYYNNYSLTQPRHFCKNCRRYWTQGGSLRNVPVGGGCRKNKRVKQRTVDPHSLVSLDETASSMLASLHSGGAGGFLPTSFQPAPGPPAPGFGDLVPSNDSHLLSMAFSRLQESLRLGEHSGAGNRSQLSLMSNMQSSPYDSGLIYTSASVKPEHGAVIYNGSELGSLFDPGSHLTAGSATATLATLEDQLTNFGVPVDAFNACTLEAQLKLQHQHHQKQLALHLGADHHMHTQHHNNSSGSVVDRAANHHALPDFEDHESSETINMMRRHATKGRTMMGIDGRSLDNWHQAPATNEGNMGGENIYEPVNAAAADNQSFWSHSPWTDVHTLTGSTAGALL